MGYFDTGQHEFAAAHKPVRIKPLPNSKVLCHRSETQLRLQLIRAFEQDNWNALALF